MKVEKILEEIWKEKGKGNYFITSEWLGKKLKIHPIDAEDILNFGVGCGVFYSPIENEFDFKQIIPPKSIQEFQDFIDKFFRNIRLKYQIEEFFDKRHLAKQFLQINPIYFDRNKIWWVWDQENFKWKIVDEIDILNILNELCKTNTINSKEKNEILEALKQEARLLEPKEIKESWVQFNNRIYDLETKENFNASPEYFVTNPIKWKLGESEETPEIDKLFVSWVSEENKQILYEIIAFSIVPSYFVHRLFCLIGSGANGKSTYLNLIGKFVGEENITSSSLYLLLQQRFEGSKLLKKLICFMGETNFNLITNTDYLKKLTGKDLIRAEFKGKNCFDFRNYAKLIMATNSLPPTADKTEGFYRRWKIIDFPYKFKKEEDILKRIPEKEFENLAFKSLKIAKRLWEDRVFTNDGDFEERKKIYEEKSNPLSAFLKENYYKNLNEDTLFSEFYDSFKDYLEERDYRKLSAPAVSKQLRNEGFETKLMTKKGVNARYIRGLYPKNDEIVT